MLAAIASVAPAVTTTSESGSRSRPQNRCSCATIAARSAGMPGSGGYWLAPDRSASAAAASISGGPSVSGKPCPRLTEPVRAASADISEKMVVPNGRMRPTSGSAGVDVVTSPSLRPPARTPRVGCLEDQLGAGRRDERALARLLRHFLAVDL